MTRFQLCLLLLLAAPAGAADFSGAKEAPRDLLDGFKEEGTKEGLLTILAAGAAAGAATPLDGQTRDYLQRNTPLGKSATSAGALIGNDGLLIPAAAGVYLGGVLGKSDGVQEFGLMSFEALSIAGLETVVLKYPVNRERPDRSDRQSFPSGHSSAAFSVATVAACDYGWKAGVPAYLAAGFVGYTRMESNKHYLSDVLFGAGLGIAAGRAVYKVRRSRRPERFTFVPYAAPGGAGVAVLF